MNAFDKILEIQVGFEVLASILKDGRKKYVKAGDAVSRGHTISSSTTMSDIAEMEAILAWFEEFKKINGEEKDE